MNKRSNMVGGKVLAISLFVCAGWFAGTRAFAVDWPQWRYDAGRTAASPEQLPAELHLQWVRRLPTPRPAWPKYPRLCFDTSYEPVVMGKTMFVPSMVTDSLAAVDTATGAQRWKFYTDGPVRFAPVASKGKVYFVSDDGYLYCLNAADGKLTWKFRGLPADCKDRKVLGNDRLISLYPARGGPVTADGKIYFAAGIWPFEGVYVYALDAETGKPVWSNKDTGYLKDGLIDHGARREGGLSPQGYLAVLGEKLVVPSGRALPGFFDRRSGRMDPYTSGWGGRVALAKGSWYVCGTGKYFFQSGDLYGLMPSDASTKELNRPEELVSFEDFAKRANVSLQTVQRWAKAGNVPTVERDGKRLVRCHKPATLTHLSWWTGSSPRSGEKHALRAHPRLQIDPANAKELGEFREPVLTKEAVYYSCPVNKQQGYRPAGVGYDAIVARDLTNSKWGVTCTSGWGEPMQFVQWKTMAFNRIWSLESQLKVHIKAGSRLYGGTNGVVAAVDIPEQGGSPKVSWQADIEGTPSRMLAADGKLFVVTREGSIYAFGPKKIRPNIHATAEQKPAPAVADQWAQVADNILKATDVKEGYCLMLGVGSGRLAAELATRSKLHVIAVDPDAAVVQKLRSEFDKAGLYGRRIVVHQGATLSYQFPPYIASLIVSENPAAAGLDSGEELAKRVFRSLRPYGGVACLPVPADRQEAFAGSVKAAGLTGAEVSRAGEFALLRRAGALAGSADWTHENGDAGNSLVSRDKLVKPPFGVLWFGGAVDMLFPAWDYTHFCAPTPLVVGGRMFFQVFPKLHAVDIYTGRRLWTSALPETDLDTHRRRFKYVAGADSVYVLSGGTCFRIDAATGSTLSKIPSPVEGAAWRDVRIWNDCLIGAAGKVLFCVDRKTGDTRWKYQAGGQLVDFAVGSGKVFCADALLPDRKGKVTEPKGSLVALDASSGKQLWQVAMKVQDPKRHPLWLGYSEANDILLAVYKTVSAYAGKDGSLLWDKAIKGSYFNWPYMARPGMGGPMLHCDRLITQLGEMYDPRTGSQLPGRFWGGNPNNVTRGCNRAIAGEHMALIRDAHVSYFDFSTCRQTYLRGVRSGCTNSLIAADGLLNLPNFAHGCSCNYPVFASLALVPTTQLDD